MNKILKLRLEGKSYDQISKALGVPKSTVAYQVSDRVKHLAATRRKRRRHKIKALAVGHLGGKCMVCGYNRCLAALEFHHDDPTVKENSIGNRQGRSFIHILPELEKCSLLCSNCHREVHAGLLVLSKLVPAIGNAPTTQP